MGRPRAAIDKQTLRALSRRYAAGEPVKQLSATFAIGKDRLYRLFAEAGVPKRGRVAHRQATLAKHKGIAAFIRRHPNASLRQVADSFSMSRSQAGHVVRSLRSRR